MDKAFRIILLPFIVLAAVGFVLSVAAHISAVAGHPIPGGKAVWALHIGIFIVWFPTVLVAYRLTRVTVKHPQPPGEAPPEVVRGFSGHWMVFYSAAFATLYSASVIGYSGLDRKCPNGHTVAVTAKYCDECGAELPPSFLDRRT